MARLNEVAQVDLDIHELGDVTFEVEWWEGDNGDIAVDLSGGIGAIVTEHETHDLAPFTTVVGNSATVLIPQATIATWIDFQSGTWQYGLVSTLGEKKPVMQGNVRFFPSP